VPVAHRTRGGAFDRYPGRRAARNEPPVAAGRGDDSLNINAFPLRFATLAVVMAALSKPLLLVRFDIGGVFAFFDIAQFVFCQRTPLTRLQFAQTDGADSGADQSNDRESQCIEHAAHLPVFAFVQYEFNQGRARFRPASDNRRSRRCGHVSVGEL
jgi:hypothetical protein